MKALDDICLNNDSGKVSVLLLLDLGATFDTVGHTIIVQRLENRVGSVESLCHCIKQIDDFCPGLRFKFQ